MSKLLSIFSGFFSEFKLYFIIGLIIAVIAAIVGSYIKGYSNGSNAKENELKATYNKVLEQKLEDQAKKMNEQYQANLKAQKAVDDANVKTVIQKQTIKKIIHDSPNLSNKDCALTDDQLKKINQAHKNPYLQ